MLSKYNSESYLDLSKAWKAAAKFAMYGLENFLARMLVLKFQI